jgi:hypothetical protein
MEEKMENKEDKIIKLDNGNMIVEVTFDVAKHGHSLGKPRNYNMQKYQAMIDSDKTKKHIKNGYCLIFYSHEARTPSKNYLAFERDKDGNYQLPVGRVLEVSFSHPSTVKFKALILNNAMGKEVQKLIESGVGGFSLVNDLKNKILLGIDFVLSPNFSSNRVITDETCKNGMCNISLDTVQQKIEDELEKSVSAYLDGIGVDDKDVFNAIVTLERQTQEYHDSIELVKSFEVARDDIELEHAMQYNELKVQLDTIEKSKKDILEKFDDFIENKYKKIIAQLDSLGFEIDENYKIVATEKVLGRIFKNTSLDDVLGEQYENVKKIQLRNKKLDEKKIKKAFKFGL